MVTLKKHNTYCTLNR